MQTAASKGRWVIVEVDAFGRERVVDESASAVSKPLRPHQERRLVHERITLGDHHHDHGR